MYISKTMAVSYNIFVIFSISCFFEGIFLHPTTFGLSESQERDDFEIITPSNDSAVVLCADGRGPLLEGDGVVYPCTGDCPEGFDCEHFSQGMVDKGGICCPNLNELYRLYSKEYVNLIQTASSTEPLNLMESTDAVIRTESSSTSRENSGRFSKDMPRRKQEKHFDFKQDKSNFGSEILSAESFSCHRQRLEMFCENGVRQTQFVMRWYYREGVCLSYPWGYCPGEPVSSDPTLRTEEECQVLCSKPVENVAEFDLDLANVNNDNSNARNGNLRSSGSEERGIPRNIIHPPGITEAVNSTEKESNNNAQNINSIVIPINGSNSQNLSTTTAIGSLSTAITTTSAVVVNSTSTIGGDGPSRGNSTSLQSNSSFAQIHNNSTVDATSLRNSTEFLSQSAAKRSLNNSNSSSTNSPRDPKTGENRLVSNNEQMQESREENSDDGHFTFHAATEDRPQPRKKCEKVTPYRAMCEDSGMPSQFTLRWHLRGDKCELYPYGYCHGESVQDEGPIKTEEECVSFCIKKPAAKRNRSQQ